MTDRERYRDALLSFTTTEASSFALRTVVFELMLEVEALRRTVAASPELVGRYAEHYRDVHLRARNAAGATPAGEKAIAAFLGGDGPRDEAMLRTLGVDVAEFRERAEFLEQLS